LDGGPEEVWWITRPLLGIDIGTLMESRFPGLPFEPKPDRSRDALPYRIGLVLRDVAEDDYDMIEDCSSQSCDDDDQRMLTDRLQEEEQTRRSAADEFVALSLPSPSAAPTSIDSSDSLSEAPLASMPDVCFCGRSRPGELRIISEAPCPRHDLRASVASESLPAVSTNSVYTIFVSPIAGGTIAVSFHPEVTTWRDIYAKVSMATSMPFPSFVLLLEGRPCADLDGVLLTIHRDLRLCQSGWLRGGGADLDDVLSGDDENDPKYRKMNEGKGSGAASSSSAGKGVEALKVDANQQFRDMIKCEVSQMMQQFGETLCSRFESSIATTVKELRESHAQTQKDLKAIHQRLDVESGERKMLKVELQGQIESIRLADACAPPSPTPSSQPAARRASAVAQPQAEGEILAVLGAWPKRTRAAIVKQDVEHILSKLPCSAKESLVETWVPGASSKIAFARFSSWGGLWAFVRAVKQARVPNQRLGEQQGVRFFWASKSKSADELKRVGPVSRAVFWMKSKLGISKDAEDDTNARVPVCDVAGEYGFGKEGVFATTNSWNSELLLIDFSAPRDRQVDDAVLQQVCAGASATELLEYIHAGGN